MFCSDLQVSFSLNKTNVADVHGPISHSLLFFFYTLFLGNLGHSPSFKSLLHADDSQIRASDSRVSTELLTYLFGPRGYPIGISIHMHIPNGTHRLLPSFDCRDKSEHQSSCPSQRLYSLTSDPRMLTPSISMPASPKL